MIKFPETSMKERTSFPAKNIVLDWKRHLKVQKQRRNGQRKAKGVCVRTLVGGVEVVGHGGLRRARLRGHEAGAEGVEEGGPAPGTAHGTLGGGRRRGGDGGAGQLAAAAGVAPPPGRSTPAAAPHLGTPGRQCTRSAVQAAVACGDERQVVALPLAACLDGWELESCGLMTTRGVLPARQVGLVRNRTRLLRCT